MLKSATMQRASSYKPLNCVHVVSLLDYVFRNPNSDNRKRCPVSINTSGVLFKPYIYGFLFLSKTESLHSFHRLSRKSSRSIQVMSTTPPHLISYQSTSSDASEPVELAYTPTWSAHLPDSANNTMAQPEPNVYLQLAQVLEWEIWTHSQTRAKLLSECMRSTELVAQVNRLSNELQVLRKLCQTPQPEKKGSSVILYSNPKQERKV